jgi:hypothetical protein
VAPVTWSTDEAAVQVDAYLDQLLASRTRPVAAVDAATLELAHAAAVMRGALVRFHPSFRFEEELATRLRGIALGAARASTVVRFPVPGAVTLSPAGAATSAAGPEPGAGLLGGPSAGQGASAERAWVLVGGAIASGVSLAAGVLLARRRSRGDGRWERFG